MKTSAGITAGDKMMAPLNGPPVTDEFKCHARLQVAAMQVLSDIAHCHVILHWLTNAPPDGIVLFAGVRPGPVDTVELSARPGASVLLPQSCFVLPARCLHSLLVPLGIRCRFAAGADRLLRTTSIKVSDYVCCGDRTENPIKSFYCHIVESCPIFDRLIQ